MRTVTLREDFTPQKKAAVIELLVAEGFEVIGEDITAPAALVRRLQAGIPAMAIDYLVGSVSGTNAIRIEELPTSALPSMVYKKYEEIISRV